MKNQEIKEILLKAINEWEELYLYALKTDDEDLIYDYAEQKQMEDGLCYYFLEYTQITDLIVCKLGSKLSLICDTITDIYYKVEPCVIDILNTIRTRIDFLEELIKDLEK